MRACVREREENFDYFVEQNRICDPFSRNESLLKIWQLEISACLKSASSARYFDIYRTSS